jgi:hypothetical protein
METLATYAGWAASLLVIGSYVLSAVKSNPLVFHWGNVLGCLVLVPVQIYLGVAFTALLSASFGIVAGLALWREYNPLASGPGGRPTKPSCGSSTLPEGSMRT